MRNTSLLLIGGVVMASLSSAATAAVVFRDNFENVTGATAPFPQTSVDADPSAQVGSWTINEPADENVQVSKDYSPIEGTQCLVSNRNGTGGIQLRANFSSPAPVSPPDGLTVSFKYRDPAPDSAFGGTVDKIELYGYNDSDNGFDNQAFQLQLYKNWGSAGRVYVGFGGNSSLSAPENNGFFATNDPDLNWQQVDIAFDFVSHTYTFSLNGSALPGTTNIPFDGDAATANQLQQLLFYHVYADNSRWALDDITVTTTAVPEPASIAGLALASMALVARRRR